MVDEDTSPYQTALEAAGAEVTAFKEFGSYEGKWFAKVVFNGMNGFVHGGYGSCEGCDAFLGEFGETYSDKRNDSQERLKAFGLNYLDDILTLEEALEVAEEHIAYDIDADEMVAWLKAHSGAKPHVFKHRGAWRIKFADGSVDCVPTLK